MNTVRLSPGTANRLRLHQGLLLGEVAKACGLSSRTIGAAFRGRAVSLVTARKVAAELGVNLMDILAPDLAAQAV